MSPVWMDGRQSRNFMNINDDPDLCLGLLPQMPAALCFPRHYWFRLRWTDVYFL